MLITICLLSLVAVALGFWIVLEVNELERIAEVMMRDEESDE